MESSRFRVMQVMLSSQEGGAETFFEKLCLALADAGVRQYLVIEPNARREALLAAHPLIDVRTIRFRGIREIPGRIRIRRYARQVQPTLIMSWLNRAVKRTPRGFCPIIARMGGYYEVDRYRDCDRLIGNTPDLVDYFLKNGIPSDRVECIPNFGDIRQLAVSRDEARARIRTELGIPAHHRLLLALGRLHPCKALDVLIRSIAPIPNVSVAIAGEGPLRQSLQDLAVEVGVADRVHFLGWRSDTVELYAAADISVFPSRAEAFGNVVVESWGQRVPLIAARSVGPAWLIDDGVDGLLFDIDQVEQLTDRLRTLLAHPELGERLVEAGFAKLQRQFSRESIVKRYIAMFDEVVRRSSGQPTAGAGS